MSWKNIDGWFNDGDEQMYLNILGSIPEGGHFLEVGCFKGRSTVCMAEAITKYNRNITIHVVDTFEGDVDTGAQETYKEFMKNMEPYRHLLGSVMKGYSIHMAKENQVMFDAIYIDALHTYDSVTCDIVSWVPHLRLGGTIGGHDYNWSEVHKAVNDKFTEIIPIGNSWIVYTA